MNKIYKLVFSKILNEVVAVSELAKSAQPGSQATELKLAENEQRQESAAKKLIFNLNKVMLGSLFLMMGVPAITAHANTNTPQPTNDRPVATLSMNNGAITVDDSTATSLTVEDFNGTAVINIVNPDANGISDNRFSKFSTEKGAVFNNQVNQNILVESKVLGQKLKGNANLKEAAKVIIAQVTGNDKSVIKGALEVLGQKADLMIVNPNGIDLNGSSLINVKDFTATTGKLAGDELTVTQGEINVNGDLTTDEVNMIRLIAKAVKVKATIAPSAEFAKKTGKKADIVISAGKHKYNLKTDKASRIDNKVTDQPVAISGAALGAMYGSKINFIVSESGAGVEFDGMVMGEDNISITADGVVKINNVITEKDLNISTKGAVEFGTANASSKLGKVDKSTLAKTNSETAANAEAVAVRNQDADAKKSANIVKAKNLKVKSSSTKVKDTVVAVSESVKLNNGDDVRQAKVDFDKGSVVSTKNLEVKATNVEFNKDAKLSATEARVDAGDRAVISGVIAADDLNVSVENVSLDNSKGLFVKDAHAVVNNLVLKSQKHVTFDKADVTAGNLSVDTLLLNAHNGTKLAANLINSVYTKNFSRISIDITSSIGANKHSVTTHEIGKTELASVSNVADAARLDNYLGQITAKETKVSLQDINVAANEIMQIKNANKIALAGNFINKGVFNFTAKNISAGAKNNLNAPDTSVVLTASGAIQNSGLIVADSLGLKAYDNVENSGLIFTYKDFTIVAPTIRQIAGDVEVGTNYTVITDNYQVEAKVSGRYTTIVKDQFHYDHRIKNTWNNHKYDIWMSDIDIDNQMTTQGGKIKVGGDFTVARLQGSTFAEGTSSADKAAEVADQQIRFQGENSVVTVGGNFIIDGSFHSRVDNTAIDVLDAWAAKQEVTFFWVPLSKGFNNHLAIRKELKFNSIQDFFETIFEIRGKKMSWNTAAYSIKKDAVMDIFKARFMQGGDVHMKQMFAAVFGADWYSKNYNQLRAAYIAQDQLKTGDTRRVKVQLFTPGAQLTVGGSFAQTHGDFVLGVGNQQFTNTVKNADGSFSIDYDRSVVAYSAKALDNKTAKESLSLLEKRGLIKRDLDGSYKSRIDLGEAKVKVSRYYHGEMNPNFIADDATLSAMLIEQLVTETGIDATDEEAAKLLSDILEDGYNQVLRDKTRVYRNATGKYSYDYIDFKGQRQQGEQTISELLDDIDNSSHLTWAQDPITRRYIPQLHLNPAAKAKVSNAAAELKAKREIRIQNAGNVDVNYATLEAGKVSIDAQNINLRSDAEIQSIIAKKSNIKADQLNVIGVVTLGNTEITAKDATFTAAAVYNQDGALVNVGGARVSAAKLKIENDLTLRGFTIAGTKNISMDVGHDLRLEATYDIASRYTKEELKNAYGQVQTYEKSANVQSSALTTSEGSLDVKVGHDMVAESAKLKAKENATFEVDNNFTSVGKQNVYQSRSVERKVDVKGSAQVNFGHAKVAVDAHFANHDQEVVTEVEKESYADISKTGGRPASAGFSISITRSEDNVSKLTAVNTKLDAQNLTLKVGETADISNTSINKEAELKERVAAMAENREPEKVTATITAKDVTQENTVVDSLVKTHKESGMKLQLETYVGGSALDLASHAASMIRANANGEKLDAMTAPLQVIGDVAGLVTRDVFKVGVTASSTIGKSKTKTAEVADSTNEMAGNVVIKAEEDVHLKNLQVKHSESFEVEAGDEVLLEGGKRQAESKSENFAVTTSVDYNVGFGITGITPGGSSTISTHYGNNKMSAEKYEASHIDTDNFKLKAKNATLDNTVVETKVADVEVEENLKLVSRQDKVESLSEGYDGAVSAGMTTLGRITPSQTSVTGGYSREKESLLKVNEQAGITATESLKVKADSLELVGAKLVAQAEDGSESEIELDVNKVSSETLQDKVYRDGGSFRASFGSSKKSPIRADLQGGREDHYAYNANVKATIAGEGLDKEDLAAKTVSGAVNTDVSDAIHVTREESTQGTHMGVTIDSASIKRAIKAGKQATSYAQASLGKGESTSGAYASGYQTGTAGASMTSTATSYSSYGASSSESSMLDTKGVVFRSAAESTASDASAGAEHANKASTGMIDKVEVDKLKITGVDDDFEEADITDPTLNNVFVDNNVENPGVDLTQPTIDIGHIKLPTADKESVVETAKPNPVVNEVTEERPTEVPKVISEEKLEETKVTNQEDADTKLTEKVVEEISNVAISDGTVSEGKVGGGNNLTGTTDAEATNGSNHGSNGSGSNSGTGNSSSTNSSSNAGAGSNGTSGNNSTTIDKDVKDQTNAIEREVSNLENQDTSKITGGSGSTNNHDYSTGSSGMVDAGETASAGNDVGNGGLVGGNTINESGTSGVDTTNVDSEESSSTTTTDSTTIVNPDGDQTNVGVIDGHESNFIPADGTGASNGEVLDFTETTSVTKYSIDGVTCYVMTPKDGGKGNKIKEGNGVTAAKSRSTIFSTYSTGIQEAIGDTGVLCVNTASLDKSQETEFNVLQAATDIPVIKTLAPVKGTVVSRKGIERVVVRSNRSKEAQKVVRQVADISVSEVARVRATLKAKGIDASKIMFLGSKSASTSEVERLVRAMPSQATQKTSFASKASSVLKD